MWVPDSILPVFTAQARRKQQGLQDYLDDILLQVQKRIEAQEDFSITLADKTALSEWIIEKAYQNHPTEKMALAWTGGKDSTVLLWIVRRWCRVHQMPLPPLMLINEGDMFPEIVAFVKKITNEWKLRVTEVGNDDLLTRKLKLGDSVAVSALNTRNRMELKRIGYTKKKLVYEPESFAGNHLMKTVAQNIYLEKQATEALITGIRWDEQEARSKEAYFSPRGDEFTPRHTRIHPLLHFSEADIWQLIRNEKIPMCSLYAQGYRSLGAKSTTQKITDKPAWKQDLVHTKERAGRQQDKEGVMKRLRDLGYM